METKLLCSIEKTVHLEITNRCRLACSKCERTWLLKDKKSNFKPSADLSLKVIEKYSNLDYNKFLLCGSKGDPIYHPQFIEIVKILKSKNKQIHIHTNGSGKKLEWWKKLFSELNEDDVIWFSIDGMADTCGKYRVNFTSKDFYQAIDIMRIARHEYGLNPIWMFIPFSFNEHQIEDAKKLAYDLDIMFCLRKSARWVEKNDPLLPKNNDLISKQTQLLI